MSEKKVLLVDDDSMCLRFMEVVLEDKYILKLAHSGEEALAMVGEFKPDLVVLDVMMPGIDAFTVSQSLRNSDTTEKTKIVFVSSKEPNIKKKIDMNNHGYGFLLKPFNPDDLDNQVERLLTA